MAKITIEELGMRLAILKRKLADATKTFKDAETLATQEIAHMEAFVGNAMIQQNRAQVRCSWGVFTAHHKLDVQVIDELQFKDWLTDNPGRAMALIGIFLLKHGLPSEFIGLEEPLPPGVEAQHSITSFFTPKE